MNTALIVLLVGMLLVVWCTMSLMIDHSYKMMLSTIHSGKGIEQTYLSRVLIRVIKLRIVRRHDRVLVDFRSPVTLWENYATHESSPYKNAEQAAVDLCQLFKQERTKFLALPYVREVTNIELGD